MRLGRHADDQGEEGTFELFVQVRQRHLLRFGWVLTGDWVSAQDLLQAALLKVWKRWHTIDGDGADAYVRQTMVHVHLSWRRRRWRGEQPTEALPDHVGADPWEQAELAQDLAGALAKLTPRQRTTVALRYFDDLTEAQTAQVTQCSVGTVKSQSAKALAALRGNVALRGLLEGGAAR